MCVVVVLGAHIFVGRDSLVFSVMDFYLDCIVLLVTIFIIVASG